MSGARQSELSKNDAHSDAAIYLITVAGSAGALESLNQLLARSLRLRSAALIALLHGGRSSQLPDVLRFRSSLPVQDATSGLLLERGCVYAPREGRHVIVNPDARLTVCESPHRRFRPSAEWLFESAAASFRDRHIAIVLGGLLDDGASRLHVVKASGGTVLVQDPASCIFADMPQAAIARGAIDAVLPIWQMPAFIAGWLQKRDPDIDRLSWEEPFSLCS